jgi:haloalkane dehalogenase
MSGYGVRTADAYARSARAATGPDGVGSTSMQTLRTPDDRFADLPGYSFAPHYADIADGEGGTLRVHYVREGDPSAPVVLLMHGEPSWSYLYRTMIPVLTGAGLQIVAPDLVGFGRSDKPAERTDYTFARHVEWMRELLFDRLDLTDINLVCQDWGGLIGLRLVGEHPGRFARVVAANTFLPTGDTNPGDAFFAWQKFSQEVEVFPTGVIVRGGCAKPVAPEVEAAYDAPFPDESYKSGARQFPLLVPSQPDDPAHDANVAAWVGLAAFDRPFLCAFSDSDPITKGADRNLKERIAGAQGQPHTTIVGGGHFLQEDCGEDLAAVVVSFVTATP